MAEGCILIVCASLPTLGPLFRAARGKLTDASRGTGQPSRDQLGNSQGLSLGGGDRDWDNVKGHKLDSDAEQSSLRLRPSFDAIPLVTSSKAHTNGDIDLEATAGIHKTMEVSVSSTSFTDRRRQQGTTSF